MKKTKNLKRVLACLLAVLMCFGSIILSAAAGDSTTVLYLDELEDASTLKAVSGAAVVDTANKYSGNGSFSVSDTQGVVTNIIVYRTHAETVDLSAAGKDGNKIAIYVNPSTLTGVNYIEVRFYDDRPINDDFSIDWAAGLWATGGVIYQIPASNLKAGEWNKIEIDKNTAAAHGSFAGVDWTKIKMVDLELNKATDTKVTVNFDKLMIEGPASEEEEDFKYTMIEDFNSKTDVGQAMAADTNFSNRELSTSGVSGSQALKLTASGNNYAYLSISNINPNNHKYLVMYINSSTGDAKFKVRPHASNNGSSGSFFSGADVYRYQPGGTAEKLSPSEGYITLKQGGYYYRFDMSAIPSDVDLTKMWALAIGLVAASGSTIVIDDIYTTDSDSTQAPGFESSDEEAFNHIMVEDYNSKTNVTNTLTTTADIAMGSYVLAKEGYTGEWDKDGKNITADTTITAVYTEIPDDGGDEGEDDGNGDDTGNEGGEDDGSGSGNEGDSGNDNTGDEGEDDGDNDTDKDDEGEDNAETGVATFSIAALIALMLASVVVFVFKKKRSF